MKTLETLLWSVRYRSRNYKLTVTTEGEAGSTREKTASDQLNQKFPSRKSLNLLKGVSSMCTQKECVFCCCVECSISFHEMLLVDDFVSFFFSQADCLYSCSINY